MGTGGYDRYRWSDTGLNDACNPPHTQSIPSTVFPSIWIQYLLGVLTIYSWYQGFYSITIGILQYRDITGELPKDPYYYLYTVSYSSSYGYHLY